MTTNTTLPAGVPDLTTYYAVHQAMRRSNESLVRAIGATEAGDVRRITAIAHWFDGYVGELHNHHRNEDDVFFPALAARVPAFAEYERSLADEHHQLDAILQELAATLARWALDADSCEPHARALDLAVDLHDLLRTHLDVEDTEVVPMFECWFTADEYAELDRKVMKGLDLRQALFTVPWFMATVDPEVSAAALRSAPLALRVLHRLTRNRYARLWHEAFGAE